MDDRLTKLGRVLRRKYYALTVGQWGLVGLVLALILSPLGSPGGRGFKEKTWWNWLEVAGVPATLAFTGLWFQHQQRQRDKEERENQRNKDIEEQREETMQGYFDRVSSLLIEKNLIDRADAVARIGDDRNDPLVESAKDIIRA